MLTVYKENISIPLTSFLLKWVVHLNEDEERFQCRLCSDRRSEFITDLEWDFCPALTIIDHLKN